MGIGVFTMAASPCGSFEVQTYQCEFASGPGSSFVGFAVRVDGNKIITAIGDQNGNVNLRNPDGVETIQAGTWTGIKATDKCAILYVGAQEWHETPGYEMSMNLQMAEFKANHGVCTDPDSKELVPKSEILFSNAEMAQFCTKCPSESCTAFQGNLMEMNKGEVLPEEANQMCKDKGVPVDDANAFCTTKMTQTAHGDAPFEHGACVYDYCVSGGNPEAIDNDVQAELAEEALE